MHIADLPPPLIASLQYVTEAMHLAIFGTVKFLILCPKPKAEGKRRDSAYYQGDCEYDTTFSI